VERALPTGKPALVAAVVGHYLTQFSQRLAQHGPLSANAVEEMLRVRQTLQALPEEMRSLFMHELAADYPTLYQQLRTERLTIVLHYMRLNLQRGQAEGLYHPHLNVEKEAQQWFDQADAAVQAATDSYQLADLLTAQVLHFLARVTTPAGAFVTRRLQEAAPYY
jgi:AcrR family transcriptional regulator